MSERKHHPDFPVLYFTDRLERWSVAAAHSWRCSTGTSASAPLTAGAAAWSTTGWALNALLAEREAGR